MCSVGYFTKQAVTTMAVYTERVVDDTYNIILSWKLGGLYVCIQIVELKLRRNLFLVVFRWPGSAEMLYLWLLPISSCPVSRC